MSGIRCGSGGARVVFVREEGWKGNYGGTVRVFLFSFPLFFSFYSLVTAEGFRWIVWIFGRLGAFLPSTAACIHTNCSTIPRSSDLDIGRLVKLWVSYNEKL